MTIYLIQNYKRVTRRITFFLVKRIVFNVCRRIARITVAGSRRVSFFDLMDREEKYFLSEIEKGISFYDAHFKLYLKQRQETFCTRMFPTDRNCILFALKLHDLRIASVSISKLNLLLIVEAWKKHFAISKFFPRGTSSKMLLLIASI